MGGIWLQANLGGECVLLEHRDIRRASTPTPLIKEQSAPKEPGQV